MKLKAASIKKCIIISFLCGMLLCINVDAKVKLPIFKAGTTGLTLKKNDFYLLDENSKVLTGWQNYAGNLYYFSKRSGKMFYGVQKIGKSYYYFDENGCCVPDVAFNDNKSLKHGFYKSNGDTRYFFNGSMLKGFAQISGVNYYFNEETGIMEDYDEALAEYRSTFADNKQPQNNQSLNEPYVTVANTLLHSTYYSDKNDNERTLLAAIIYCEAGNQKATQYTTIDGKTVYKGMLGVGYVIVNRMTDKLGIKEVIYKKNQFSPARTGKLTAVLNQPEQISEAAYNAADVILYYVHNNIETVPEYPKHSFRWSNFWSKKYAEQMTNFFSVFTNDDEYEIIQDQIYFDYKQALKANR